MDKLARVDVLIGDSRKAPECPHGPTLLFKRIVDGEDRLFFACSTCRDRKDCRFFLWADEKLSDTKKKVWELEKQKFLPKVEHSKLYVKLMKICQSSINRIYCHSCADLVQDLSKHSGHDITSNLTDYQLTHPSEVLKPLENAKKEAQYLFSKQSTRTIVSSLQNLGIKHVLCIGAPRIHEYILSNETSTRMDSVLLDIDVRYRNFHGPLQFCWFNFFNNHYFDGNVSAQVVSDFLQQDSGNNVAIVIDPPFGGKIEPIANTIRQIMEQHKSLNNRKRSNIKVMWISPYFMEPQIAPSLYGFNMLDYKVDYVNHPLFKQGAKGAKFGSPVRIFTNVPASKVPLPLDEGYRYCKPCKRWSNAENLHCKKCKCCPSKDGRTYTHCNLCKRCVKPSWSHCDECNRCSQTAHKCGEFQPSNLCYHCNESGHKRGDCPKIKAKLRMESVANGKNGGVKRKLARVGESDGVVAKVQKNTMEKSNREKKRMMDKIRKANNKKMKKKIEV